MKELNQPCRSCQTQKLDLVLSLGRMPLANALISENELHNKEDLYPLDLVFCPKCGLVQITETVPPKILFDEYLYFSSYSDTMLLHARDLVNHIVERFQVGQNSLIIEIASNDGYLLQYFVPHQIPVLGIEPAKNIALKAEEKGIRTECMFFNEETADHLIKQGKNCDILIGLNVLAHVADLPGFVRGVQKVLKPNGTAIFEVPYVVDMIHKNEFDTIYHEHLCYYSLSSLQFLFRQFRMEITDVDRISIHGGSLRIFVQHRENSEILDSVNDLVNLENREGIDKLPYYLHFAENILQLKRKTIDLLDTLKEQGNQIIGYGAAAKASTLLNYYGIGAKYVDYICDKSPYKQGKYIPGPRIPIVSPEKIFQTKPDYVLIFPWNIKEEIIDQLRDIHNWGGKFIIPIPEVEVVDA
jgi:SAM-dependent methyltransferase